MSLFNYFSICETYCTLSIITINLLFLTNFHFTHMQADSSSQKPVDDIHNFYAIIISE